LQIYTKEFNSVHKNSEKVSFAGFHAAVSSIFPATCAVIDLENQRFETLLFLLYYFAIPKGKSIYTTREKLFKGVEPVFKDVEHWFLGVEHRFHAQEQQNHLRLKQNSSSNQKKLLRLVEQRQAIAEGEEDVRSLAECLGFAPLGVSHRGLESAVAVQDVVPSDADAGTFAFEEPVIGSK